MAQSLAKPEQKIMSGQIFVALALGLVVVILLAGLFALFRPGQKARNLSNQLMRWRVLAQALAIVVIMTVLYLNGR